MSAWNSGSYRCIHCGIDSDHRSSKCYFCGRVGGVMPIEAYLKRQSNAETAKNHKPRTLADAPVLDSVRISTGFLSLDKVFGTSWRTKKSGINLPSTTLFGGAAGCGKTTLTMMISAYIRSAGFLYISAEQTLAEVRENAERCGLTEEQIAEIQAANTNELQEAIGIIHEIDPRIVVIDSLNEMKDSVRDTSDLQMNLVRMTDAFKVEAESNRRAIILISHLNKKDDFAGMKRVQHIVSTVMLIQKMGETQRRVVHCPSKNRFGSTSDKAYFMMTERGLEEVDPPEPKDEGGDEESADY